MKVRVIYFLLGLLLACTRDNLPTDSGASAAGRIVIVLKKEQPETVLSTVKKDSSTVLPDKAKSVKQPFLSAAVDRLEVRVLKSNKSLLITPQFFTNIVDGYFDGTIVIEPEKVQNDLKVLCIGTNNGIVKRFGIANDVDVLPGVTVPAEPVGWYADYFPRITAITPDPSPDGSYTVFWKEVTGADRYVLKESDNRNINGALEVYKGNNQEFHVSGKNNNTWYYYWLQAANEYDVISDWSDADSVQVIFPGPSSTIQPPKLHDPGGPVFSDTTYYITWNSVSLATSYTVEEAIDSLFSRITSRPLPVQAPDTILKFVHPVVDEPITYYYHVKATTATGSSNWSNIVAKTVIPNPVWPVMNDPGGPVFSGSSYTISWKPVDKAASYTLQESTDSSFSRFTPASYPQITGTIMSFSNGKAVDSTTTYYYRVQADLVSRKSEWSKAVAKTINPLLPPVLIDPRTYFPSGESYTLSWRRVEGATSYTIEEALDTSFINEKNPETKDDTSKVFSHTVSSKTVYFYRVKANNGPASSDWSNIVEIAVITEKFIGPILRVRAEPPDSQPLTSLILFEWSEIKGCSRYIFGISRDSSFKKIDKFDQIDPPRLRNLCNFQNDFKIDSRTPFYFGVSAIVGTDTTMWSNIVKIIIYIPAGLQSSMIENSQGTIGFDASSNISPNPVNIENPARSKRRPLFR